MLDFKPTNKKLPERNIKERSISKATGRVWVDEPDRALAKADLHFTEKVDVVGGLLGAVWNFNYTFDRKRTTEDLWYTRGMSWHLEGRDVFIRRTIDYYEERIEVRKAQQSAPQTQTLHRINSATGQWPSKANL